MIKCDEGKFAAKGDITAIKAEFASIVNGLHNSVNLSPIEILNLVHIGLTFNEEE